MKKCDKALTWGHLRCHTKSMNKETLSSDLLALLDELEADLLAEGIALDFDADEDLVVLRDAA